MVFRTYLIQPEQKQNLSLSQQNLGFFCWECVQSWLTSFFFKVLITGANYDEINVFFERLNQKPILFAQQK